MTQINNGLTPKNNPGAAVSAKTENLDLRVPSRILSCSRDAGWTSLLILKFEHSANLEQLDTPAHDDQTITVSLEGECQIESYSNGFWKKSVLPSRNRGNDPGGQNRPPAL